MSSRRYLPPEAYGLVGDGRSAALVGRDGSVDWWCPPRFDAPSVFARVLDDRIGGFCSLAPAGAIHASPMWESSQRYRPRTNVLVTEFRGADARLTVTDVMPWPGPGPDGKERGDSGARGRESDAPTLIRRVEARGGPVQAELRFAPRFDYARDRPAYRESGGGWVAEGGGGELLALAADRPPGLDVDGRRHEVSGRFRVEPGEPRWVVLRWGEREPGRVSAETARRSLEETSARWRRRAERVPSLPDDGAGHDGGRDPAGGGSFAGRARESVVRSALALDLLTDAPTGAVLEAATTSLPGAGPLRDARTLPRSRAACTAVLAGLAGLGRKREARRLARILAERGPGGPLRGDRSGSSLDHLHGHRGERPVRVGVSAGDRGDSGDSDGRDDSEHPGGPSAGAAAAGPSLARRFGEARDLALEGRPREAAERFEAAAGRAGPAGLLAEAVDPDSGRLRGNVPSARAHATLVDAARVIAAAAGREGGQAVRDGGTGGAEGAERAGRERGPQNDQ